MKDYGVYFILTALVGVLATTGVTVFLIARQNEVIALPNQKINLAVSASIGLSTGVGMGALAYMLLHDYPVLITIGAILAGLFAFFLSYYLSLTTIRS